MGQYYKTLTIDRFNVSHVNSSWKYDNGAKLMEHSYIGNKYVNDVLDRIYLNPCQVAWVGDYSNDGSYVSNDKAKGFNKYYEMCWGENAVTEEEVKEETIKFDIENCNYYLVNHSKRIYIDMEKYVQISKWHEEGNYYNGEHYSYDMCINPLPLLTACGNGQGGGDYRGSAWTPDDVYAVGSWALDVIELTDDKPFGYKETEYFFKED